MTDAELLALCVFEEAGREPDDGRAAVARVVLNRMKKRFGSDGTIRGTVLAHNQFSWVEYDFVTVHSGTGTRLESHQEYQIVARTSDQILSRVSKLLIAAKGFPKTWARISEIVAAVQAHNYSGPQYNFLTDDVVYYVNPKILTKQPSWAISKRLVCSIGNHNFYRADDPPAIV